MAKTKASTAKEPEPAPGRKRERVGVSRLNLDVPTTFSVRLGAQAELQNMSKSRFAFMLLEQGVSKYKTDKALKIALEQYSTEGEATNGGGDRQGNDH
jgi:hypothetical protein